MSKHLLKEITSKIGSGATPTGGKGAYKGGDYSLIRSQNVLDMSFLREGLVYINDEQAKKLDGVKVESGDVLFNITGDSICRCCIVPDDILPARVNQHVAIIRPKSVNSAYLMYYLQYLKPYLMSICGNGSSRNALTKDSLEKLEIEISPFSNSIAEILSSLDKKIINNKRITSELESFAKTIYDYWFLQFEFPNEEGKPYKSSGGKMVWCEELKREIPEGWKVQTISDITICEDSKRVPLSNKEREEMIGSFPYYGATGIMGYVNRYIFDGDYVLVAEDGTVMDDYFHPIIQRIHGKNWVNNHAHVLSPIKGYHCMFLMLIMKDIYVPSIKTGSIQMKINQENLNKVKICKIPDGLLRKANQIFDTVDACILQRKEEIKNLSSVRDFLLPMLMNGQVTFKDN